MKGLVLDAKWDPRPDYALSDWEKGTGKAISGNSVWRYPKLEVREWPDPQPGPNEVLLAIQACGVCGSDMHFYETDEDDYILYPGLTRFPTILGHEFSGKVVEAGKEVELLKVGDMVTVEEMIWCGRCIPCRNGYPNHCTNLEEIGFTIPGAFANFITVDEKYCWPINAIAERFGDEVKAYEVGAMTEPTTVAYNGMFERAGGFRPGHYVSVFGAGPIGLEAAIAAKRAALTAFREQRDIVTLERDSNRALNRLNTLQASLAEAEDAQIKARARLMALVRSAGYILPAGMKAPLA